MPIPSHPWLNHSWGQTSATAEQAGQPEAEQGGDGRLRGQKNEGMDVTIGGSAPSDDVAIIIYRSCSAFAGNSNAGEVWRQVGHCPCAVKEGVGMGVVAA